jgi:glycosyltransferase involved in cell wall biosynthesis
MPMRPAVVVLTLNEEPNIARVLSRLTGFDDVVVVDSQSTDRTRDIAREFPNVRVVERAFTTHAEQWNFGLAQISLGTEWVLALDADFVLTDELLREMTSLSAPSHVAGYRASFTYCIGGRPLRGTVYPPVTVLYRRNAASYVQDGHTQRVEVAGEVRSLAGRILHDDRKPIADWLRSQVKYMRLEAEKLRAAAPGSLSGADRVRQWIVVAPPLVFLYSLFVRGGLLDGKAGLFYALQRALAEAILSLHLLEAVLTRPRE